MIHREWDEMMTLDEALQNWFACGSSVIGERSTDMTTDWLRLIARVNQVRKDAGLSEMEVPDYIQEAIQYKEENK